MIRFLSQRLVLLAILVLLPWTPAEIPAPPLPGRQPEILSRPITASVETPTSEDAKPPEVINWRFLPIAALVEKLNSEDYGTRYEAASALEKLGAGAEPAIPALIEALGDGGSFVGSNWDFVWLKARRTLIVIGPPAVPALAAAVKCHSDSLIRGQALGVLADMGREAQTALPVVQVALHRETDSAAAVYALRRIDPEGELSVPTLIPNTKALIPTLIDLLQQQDPHQIAAAVARLEGFGPAAEPAIPILVKLLTHENNGVRSQSARTLGALGPKAALAVPALLKALQDEQWHSDRREVIQSLPKIAPQDRGVACALARLLKDPEKSLRWESARALGQIGRTAEVAVPDLIEALKDSEAHRSAAIALGEIGPPARAAVPALIEAMHDPSDLRLYATQAVGRIGADARAAIPALIRAFEDDFGQVPPAAIESLAQIGPVTIPALTKAIREGKPLVRQRAAETLGCLGPPSKAALPVLREALNDADKYVKVAAALALWRVEPTTEAALPVLLESLKETNAEIAGRACDALYVMGPAARPAVPALVAMLEDKTHPHLWSVVHALCGIGSLPKTAAPALAEAMRHGNPAEAALALGQMGAEAEPAVPVLIDALGDEDEYVRWAAAYLLGQIGSPGRAAVPALIKALTDAKADVRMSAACALSRMGAHARPAVSALATLLDDDDPMVRWASLAALRTLGADAVDAIPALSWMVQNQRSRAWQGPATDSQTHKDLFNVVGTGWYNREGYREELTPVLAAFRKERPVSDSERAIQILANMGPIAREAVPALLAACKDERVTVRRAALAALKTIDPQALVRAQPSAQQLQSLWSDLADDNEVTAYQAVWTFALAPEQALPWLQERLHPVPSADAARVARLIRDLNNDSFAIRDQAAKELEALGESATPAIKTALAEKPSPHLRRCLEDLLRQIAGEAPSPEQLRALRSITVLEKIGTPEARALLTALSKGAVGAGLTHEAQEALERSTRVFRNSDVRRSFRLLPKN